MVADGMATEGVKASAAMALTKFSRNIPVSAPEGLVSLLKEWEKSMLIRKN